MSTIYSFLVGWIPSQLGGIIFGLIAFVVVLIVFRIVKLVLDALPFL